MSGHVCVPVDSDTLTPFLPNGVRSHPDGKIGGSHSGRYRAPRPSQCPAEIYQLMLQCWSALPEMRPRFSACETHLKVLSTNSAVRAKHMRGNAKATTALMLCEGATALCSSAARPRLRASVSSVATDSLDPACVKAAPPSASEYSILCAVEGQPTDAHATYA
jgi:hypothetical protein